MMFESAGGDYDVTPDGKGFVRIGRQESEAEKKGMEVVVNWFEEVKRLVPVK